METKQLPFFVYGTLQSGFGNNKAIIRGRELAMRKAFLSNAIVFHYPADGCPGMFTGGPSDVVHGELFDFSSDVYDEVVQDLDLLEEFYGPNDPRNEYERVVVRVAVSTRSDGTFCDSDDEEVEYVDAYAYFSLHNPSVLGGVLVESGNWRQFLLERGEKDALDDWALAIVQGVASEDATRKPWGVEISA